MTRERSSTVSLSVVAERDVWVCLVNARGRQLVEGRIVPGGEREGPFESRRFEINLGNGGGDFTVNGKRRPVPDRPTPLGYSISPAGVRLLPESQRPTCGPGESGAQ